MFFLEVEFSSEIEIETEDRFGSSWFSISRDELENTASLVLGHTNCYPRFPYTGYLTSKCSILNGSEG